MRCAATTDSSLPAADLHIWYAVGGVELLAGGCADVVSIPLAQAETAIAATHTAEIPAHPTFTMVRRAAAPARCQQTGVHTCPGCGGAVLANPLASRTRWMTDPKVSSSLTWSFVLLPAWFRSRSSRFKVADQPSIGVRTTAFEAPC